MWTGQCLRPTHFSLGGLDPREVHVRTSLIDFRMFFQFKLTLDSKYLVSMEVSQSYNTMILREFGCTPCIRRKPIDIHAITHTRTLMVSKEVEGIVSMRPTSRFRSFQMKTMSKLRRLKPTRSKFTRFTSAQDKLR